MSIICIISDTHENISRIRLAVEKIKEINPTLVIHCGDIVSPPVLDHFKDLPMRFVFGNNDGEREGLQKKCDLYGFGKIDDEIDIKIEDIDIKVYHGTSQKHLDYLIDSQEWDYVLHGHTHIVRDERIGNTRVINPGALFMAQRFTFGKLNLTNGELEIIELL